MQELSSVGKELACCLYSLLDELFVEEKVVKGSGYRVTFAFQ